MPSAIPFNKQNPLSLRGNFITLSKVRRTHKRRTRKLETVVMSVRSCHEGDLACLKDLLAEVPMDRWVAVTLLSDPIIIAGCALSIVCLCFVAGMISSQLHGDKRDAKEQGQSSKRTMTTPERAASPHSRPKLANSVPDRSSTHAKLAPIPELSKRIESHERPAMPAGVSRARSQHAVSPGNGTPAAPQLRVILSGSCPFVQNASLDLEALQPRNVDESDKVSPRRPSPKVTPTGYEAKVTPTCSSGDLRLRRLALQNLAARGDVQDPPPQTPLPQPQRRQTRSRPSENLAARGDDSVDEVRQSESSIDFSEPEAINNYMSFMLAHELPSLPGDVQDSPPPTPLPQPQRRQTRLCPVHTR